MDVQDISKSFHTQSQIVHDAIKDVVHDAARRTHASRRQERIEEQLRQVSQEVTETVKRMKHGSN